ncbi:hypothetical protein [Nocardioides sp.]|uniref:hypothetical protein n=1 Tax=Nocardioides sp. TaxID=35761 RepID=UPI002736FE7D|nr:hypothetical protein [Nocardioides sp.]MDP3892414.1 hypothetical protein [Nocardioides sp.]
MNIRPAARQVRVGDLARHGLVLALLLTLMGAAAGAWWGERRAATATATALILVNPLEGNPFTPDSGGDRLVNLETEAQIVMSDAVAREVADRVAPGVRPRDLLEGVTVDVPPNTQLIDIRVEHADESVAVERAQAFAETYLTYRRVRTETVVSARRTQVDEQIAEHGEELAARAKELESAPPGSSRALLLQQQISDVTSQIGLLRTQYAGMQASAFDPGEVVTPAAIPDPGLLSMSVLAGALGGLVGLAAALALTVARVRRDTRIRRPDDVEGAGPTLLGTLSNRPDRTADQTSLRPIRAAVLAATSARPFVVLVGSSGDPQPRSRTATQLAHSLGRAQLEVVLVDANPLTAEAGEPGLSDVLTDRAGTDEHLTQLTTHVSALRIGTEPGRLDDLVAAPRMGDLVDDLRKRFDVLVLEGGPMDSPRTRTLLGYSDLAVMEVHEAVSRMEAVERDSAIVRDTRATLVGAVFVAVGRRRRR